jgi:hypothetical protein
MSVKNSKIKELYLHFTKTELQSITHLLESGLFGQADILIRIHQYICHLKGSDDFDKELLYKYLYGNDSKFSDIKLRVYLSKLTKVIEKFIVFSKLDEHPLTELNVITDYYSQNHLHRNVALYFKTKVDYQFKTYEEHLSYEYNYAMRKLDYINADFSHDGAKMREHFEEVMKTQRELSIFQTVKTQCDFLSLQQKYNSTWNNELESKFIDGFSDMMEDFHPVLKAYMLVYGIFKSKDSDKFQELKRMVILEDEIVFDHNRRALVSHIQNFCIKYINSGDNRFLKELFDVYKFGLKFYKKPGDLNSANYRNIVFCALQIGELDWAERFVENYRHLVIEADQNNAYYFNFARIAFQKKDFKTAMRQLLQVTYEDAFYASTARILLVKCYFELNDELPLTSCCASLTQYLNRNKEFTKQRIDNNIGFIRYVRTIQTNRLKNNKAFFQKLLDKIQESAVVEKEWLKQKVHQISGISIDLD